MDNSVVRRLEGEVSRLEDEVEALNKEIDELKDTVLRQALYAHSLAKTIEVQEKATAEFRKLRDAAEESANDFRQNAVRYDTLTGRIVGMFQNGDLPLPKWSRENAGSVDVVLEGLEVTRSARTGSCAHVRIACTVNRRTDHVNFDLMLVPQDSSVGDYPGYTFANWAAKPKALSRKRVVDGPQSKARKASAVGESGTKG